MQDFQRLIDQASIPSVCFGLGLEDLAHKANERVSLGKVVQAAFLPDILTCPMAPL